MKKSENRMNLLKAMALPAAAAIFSAPAAVMAQENQDTPTVVLSDLDSESAQQTVQPEENQPAVQEDEPAEADEKNDLPAEEQTELTAEDQAELPESAQNQPASELPAEPDLLNVAALPEAHSDEKPESNDVYIEEVELENKKGDNFYMISKEPLKAFEFSVLVDFLDSDQNSAALVFGASSNDNNNPGIWNGANCHGEYGVKYRVFGPAAGTDQIGSIPETDWTKTISLNLKVDAKGNVVYTYGNLDGEKAVLEFAMNNWKGGYLGLCAFSSAARFTDVTLVDKSNPSYVFPTGQGSQSPDGKVTLNNTSGDNFAWMADQKNKVNAFEYEADLDLSEPTESALSGGLVFGASSPTGGTWCAANVDSARQGQTDFFRLFGFFGDQATVAAPDVDMSKTLHLKLNVDADGSYVYTFGNKDGRQYTSSGVINGWNGGYMGLLSFNSKAVFSNIRFTDNSVGMEVVPIENDGRFKTDLKELTYAKGEWKVTDEGMESNAVGTGDAFLFSKTTAEDFVYTADVDFKESSGAAGLIFRNQNDNACQNCYALNISSDGEYKLWRWDRGADQYLTRVGRIDQADQYALKVIAIDGRMCCYINGVLVANVGDYTFGSQDMGQDTVLWNGYMGLINWNGHVVFQNVNIQSLSDENSPLIKNVEVIPETGTIQKKTQFFEDTPVMIQQVDNAVSEVRLNIETSSRGSVVITDESGNVYQENDLLSLKEGRNLFTIISTVGEASMVNRINVYRMGPDEVHYNEPYRDQYHYSVKEGWANDPNGMVYYQGVYHLYYQFYDANQWGPMHWMHATSTDLIHWTEEAVSFAPDIYGSMFSGCAVADPTNQSGLFSTSQGGLVAFITMNPNDDGNSGQRIRLAYSEDGGTTWQKSNEILLDYADDPIGVRDFRDPKVFKWENTWFMVVAGGPLRIYASENLVDWTPQAMYPSLHTECPDLYPIQIDGTVKWVLDRGGRYYKVGDFGQVDGVWTFTPDEYYQDKDGIMNFGADSYAAMTFYVDDFGTADHFNSFDIIAVNWMNTWDDYCRAVGDALGQNFNGTFNLLLKLGLMKDADGVYRLTQTPIDEYKSLRDADNSFHYTGIAGEGSQNPLEGFVGDTYEIEAVFKPEAGTSKVGFEVRSDNSSQKTILIYDLEKDEVYIDRSSSGVLVSGRFSDLQIQKDQGVKATRNADGTVTFHIYVDKASVELFVNDYAVAGAVQIFPDPLSRFAGVIVEGSPCQVDLSVWNLKTIWTDKAVIDKPQSIHQSSPSRVTLEAGQTTQLKACVLPVEVDQSLEWSVADGAEFAIVDANGLVTAQKRGLAVIQVSSKADPNLKAFFEVYVSQFDTNVDGMKSISGDWQILPDPEDDSTDILHLNNQGKSSNDFYMAPMAVEGDMEIVFDMKAKGCANIFVASDGTNPFNNQAYAVQIDWNRVRIFRFAGPELTAPVNVLDTYGIDLTDGSYHTFKITRIGNEITLMAAGSYTRSSDFITLAKWQIPEGEMEGFAVNGNPGVGLWDGDISFRSFHVNSLDPNVPAAKEELAAAVQNALERPDSSYPNNSLKALKDLAKKGSILLENDQANSRQISEMTEALKNAAAELADKEPLGSLWQMASRVDASQYTDDTVTPFNEALKEAEKVLMNADSSKSMIQNAYQKLTAALENLTLKPAPEKPDVPEVKPEPEKPVTPSNSVVPLSQVTLAGISEASTPSREKLPASAAPAQSAVQTYSSLYGLCAGMAAIALSVLQRKRKKN